MKKNINTKDLKIGMYIEINEKWFKHPFFSNHFKITSENQIKKIQDNDIAEVFVDFDKSDQTWHTEEPIIEEKYEEVRLRVSIMPEDFKEKINDPNIKLEERSKIVYTSSIDMMKNILDEPTDENIGEFKKGAEEIVSFIMKNEDVTKYLLNITDFDQYTYTHSVNVGLYSILLAKSLFGDSSEHDMKKLGAGFFLHDLGKVRVDNDILNKNGKLTAEEFNNIKLHVVKGYELLKETNHLTDEAKIIVLQHHERYEGNGYPYGLRGDEIHLYSKICAIADIFDAFTSNRPYRKPMPAFKALQKMKEQMIGHFQEDLFNKFVLLFKD